MKELTTKQKIFFKNVIDFYNIHQAYPTLKDLKKLTNYKSYNTIYKYINILEKKNYLQYNSKRHQIIFINQMLKKDTKISIPILDENNYLNILNATNTKILTVPNNNLKSFGIYIKDILLITNDLTHLNNKFVVIEKYKRYCIYKCFKKDNFYYLVNDNDELVLDNINLILFKVIALIRKY